MHHVLPTWRRSVHTIGLVAVLLLASLRARGAEVIVLNELMSSNGSGLTDENGDAPDWFELFNAGSQAVNLQGWGVSDDHSRPFKWVFRSTSLDPGAFLVVFASGKDRQPESQPPLAPNTLSGMRLWLRADQVNPNDPSQVRRAGATVFVRQWNDQSGLGNHATQAGEASQPAWVASGLAGQPSLRFDGANDQLLLPRPLATNSFCLVAVFRTSQSHEVDPEGSSGVGGVSGQRYLFGVQHGGDFNSGAGISVGTNGVSVYEHGSSYMPALAVYAGPVGTNPTVLAVNYDAKHPSLDLQGLLRSAGVTSPRAQVTAPVEIGLGAYGAFGGDLAEVLLYDRPLTESERRSLGRYFADKYGIVIPQPRHTSFQLNAGGEELQLTRPDGTVSDYVQFGPIARDVSWGRRPDGAGPFLFFTQPTPGSSNSTPAAAELLADPAFSHPGGFHTNAFDLTLSVTNLEAEVHYTLDGSEPTPASPMYQVPLPMRNRAGTANGISMIPTVPGGPLPSGEVFKAWVVRARAFKPNALPSGIVTRTYWVDTRGRGRYTLPVISLATDRANFFDNALGIYVPGDAPGGNYSQRSPEWERPVHIEFYETNNLAAFAQEAGVKIHGNTSQGFPIKGLDLDGTGGKGRKPFRYQIFPDRPRREFEHFLLRPTGHDQLMAFMRDELMQSLGAETGAESQASRACVVFINGEYWGLHYLKEKEDADFVAYYGDHPADDLDYLEGYAAAKAGDVAHYQSMIDFIAARDLRVPENYAEVQTRMEVPNYIDYKVCEIFYYRWDIGNHRLWRPRTPEGRWRWLQFDNDVGWGGFWAEQPAWQFNMLAADLTPSGSLHDHNNETTTFLLRRLMDNADFRRDFVNRFQDLLNTLFQPAHTMARIDRMASTLAPEMSEHTRRWRAPASLTEWRNYVDYLRTYATNRPAYARDHLRQRFGLEEPCTLSLSLAPADAGTLRLNTLELSAATNAPWSGRYFKRHPITLSAASRPGFKFAGWDGLAGLKTNSVRLLLIGDYAITARFEPDPTTLPAFTSIRRLADGRLSFRLTGSPGSTYALETAAELGAWITLPAILTGGPDGKFEYTETSPTSGLRQFYRVRLR